MSAYYLISTERNIVAATRSRPGKWRWSTTAYGEVVESGFAKTQQAAREENRRVRAEYQERMRTRGFCEQPKTVPGLADKFYMKKRTKPYQTPEEWVKHLGTFRSTAPDTLVEGISDPKIGLSPVA